MRFRAVQGYEYEGLNTSVAFPCAEYFRMNHCMVPR